MSFSRLNFATAVLVLLTFSTISSGLGSLLTGNIWKPASVIRLDKRVASWSEMVDDWWIKRESLCAKVAVVFSGRQPSVTSLKLVYAALPRNFAPVRDLLVQASCDKPGICFVFDSQRLFEKVRAESACNLEGETVLVLPDRRFSS